MAATGTPTPNIGLRRPQGTDPASVDDINYNSNLIDTKLGAVGNNSVQEQINSLNSNITKRLITTTSDNLPSIPSNADFDDYKTGGSYIVLSDSAASTISHTPRNASGRLIVVPVFSDNSLYIRQIYIPSTAADLIYCRKFVSSSVGWSTWTLQAQYVIESGTVTTSNAGTASFVKTYNTNEYACLSLFTTADVSGRMLIPYKYGDAVNGRWGLQALISGSMTPIANAQVSYVAVMMPY